MYIVRTPDDGQLLILFLRLCSLPFDGLLTVLTVIDRYPTVIFTFDRKK